MDDTENESNVDKLRPTNTILFVEVFLFLHAEIAVPLGQIEPPKVVETENP